MVGLDIVGEDGGVVWLNAGVACSWRGGGQVVWGVECGGVVCSSCTRPGLSWEPMGNPAR